MTEVEHAFEIASQVSANWATTPIAERTAILQQAAQLMENQIPSLMSVLIHEAIDFLRYYAQQISENFNNGTYCPIGVVVCISPWNFPLAIFTGQIAAALATGNTVLAKPVEQTPIIAMLAVKLLHQAGIPRDVLQLLPGSGDKTD